MASPNLLSITSVVGNTAVANVIDSAVTLVENQAASNTIVKLNSLLISNIDGANVASVDVAIVRSGYAYHIAKTISVPADSTLDLINKPVYLVEGDALTTNASANLHLQAVCSYEVVG